MANYRDRIVEFRRVRAGDLKVDPRNWRRHPPEQQKAVRDTLDRIGWAGALVARETREGMRIVDGHLRGGLDPDAVVPVLVVDLNEEEAGQVLATFDPLAMMAEADTDAVAALLDNLKEPPPFDVLDVLDIPKDKEHKPVPEAPDEEPSAEPDTKPTDVWELGAHRLMCGDATDSRHVKRLMNGVDPVCVLTDPPYSSGSFQEAGKGRGSKGTNAKYRPIANDVLSTRGYQALIKQALGEVPHASVLYMFTDWRMWLNTFDVAESSGFGVRAMIVWDKLTPGMGMGWRHQHELILCGARTAGLWKRHMGAQGDVINLGRTANELHATQKPVELLEVLLETTPFAPTVYDPFSGSGSTLMAAERLGRTCYAMELDPAYCDVTVKRWEEYTGLEARRKERPYL